MSQTCTFCGRGDSEVSAFFRPPNEVRMADGGRVSICDRCVESCHRHLSKKPDYVVEPPDKQQFREWLNDSVTETLIRALVDLRYREPLLAAFAERARLAAVDPLEPPDPEALQKLPAEFARENRVLPWRIEDNHLVVAFYNPLHILDIYDELVRQAGMPIRPALVGRDALMAALERCHGPGA